MFVRGGFEFDVADGIKIAFEFLLSFLPAKETNGVLTKPEPNAVESIDDVYPVESLARFAPPLKFRSHRLFMAQSRAEWSVGFRARLLSSWFMFRKP